MSFLDRMIFGNNLRDWLVALIITVVITVVAWIIQRIFIARFIKLTDRTKTSWDNVLAKVFSQTKLYLMVVLAFYFGSLALTFPETTDYWLGRIAFFAVLIQIAIWGNELVTGLIQRYQEEHLDDEAGNVTTLRAASFLIKLALFSIILLLALDNAGIKVDTLIASLGIGSIAVALAVQNILADLFASLSIALDQPFVIGDFIIVDDYLGTVENIGLKTTRVRSLSGEQLIFANNDLLNSRIRNYKRMGERRVLFSIGVTYQTSHQLLEKIPGMIRETIEAQASTRFDRAHFQSFGDSAMIFEVVYYVLTADYNIYMDIQQNINLALVREFEANGIEFAYPTQTLYIKNEAAVD
ncbi:MAG: mechanosensitive ion channel protein MscS [Anaerolineales bacterium]|nr:mechanosensitive ion channel family protein [Anaerolineae bacterium]PWB70499.1 MAG: mechanosensitive ion channel protein MscS [Anaerolineales bacterium]